MFSWLSELGKELLLSPKGPIQPGPSTQEHFQLKNIFNWFYFKNWAAQLLKGS